MKTENQRVVLIFSLIIFDLLSEYTYSIERRKCAMYFDFKVKIPEVIEEELLSKPNFMNVPVAIRELEKVEMIRHIQVGSCINCQPENHS